MDTVSSDQDTPRPGPALAVDLDGTLLRSDLLLESALAAARPTALAAVRVPFWLWRGKAHLKWQIARRVELDIASLPWDERDAGLVQAAAGDARSCCAPPATRDWPRPSPTTWDCSTSVLASDGQRNLSGRAKAEALVGRYGHQGFDYAGNARVDLLVWASARQAIVVNASAALARGCGACVRSRRTCRPAASASSSGSKRFACTSG